MFPEHSLSVFLWFWFWPEWRTLTPAPCGLSSWSWCCRCRTDVLRPSAWESNTNMSSTRPGSVSACGAVPVLTQHAAGWSRAAWWRRSGLCLDALCQWSGGEPGWRKPPPSPSPSESGRCRTLPPAAGPSPGKPGPPRSGPQEGAGLVWWWGWERGAALGSDLTHVCLGEVGRLVAVGQRDVEGVFKLLVSWVLVVDLTLDQISLQEAVHRSSCTDRSSMFRTELLQQHQTFEGEKDSGSVN